MKYILVIVAIFFTCLEVYADAACAAQMSARQQAKGSAAYACATLTPDQMTYGYYTDQISGTGVMYGGTCYLERCMVVNNTGSAAAQVESGWCDCDQMTFMPTTESGAPSVGAGGIGGGNLGGGSGTAAGGNGNNGSGGPAGPPCQSMCCAGGGTGASGGEISGGSIIGIDHQSLGEIISLVGVPFSLTYNSTFVKERVGLYKIVVPITYTDLPPNATGYNLKIYDESNVQVVNQSFSTAINQSFTYTWNGNLTSAAEALGPVRYKAKVTESNTAIGSNETIFEIPVGQLKAIKIGLGNWLPTIFKFYDIYNKRVINSDATVRSVQATFDSGTNTYSVPSGDASELYVFDLAGKLSKIRTGLTGQLKYELRYDSSGRLIEIEDAFFRKTTFNRDMSGRWTSITTPYNKTITVTLDSGLRLVNLKQPSNDDYTMTYYSTGGLLHTFKKPNLATSTFVYDSNGNLTEDAHSGGFVQRLLNVTNPSQLSLRKVQYSRSDKTDIITTANDSASGLRKVFDPSGPEINVTFQNNTGMVSRQGYYNQKLYSDDLRFGAKAKRITSESGGSLGIGYVSKAFSESVTLANPEDPYSVTVWTKNFVMGSLNLGSSYDPLLRKWTTTSGLGNTSSFKIDVHERVIQTQSGNLAAVDYTYLNDKLTAIQRGTRTTTFNYSSTTGLLTSVTNPLNQITSYAYDANERVTAITRPDANSINKIYNSVGQLISIQPVGRPAHNFTFNASELLAVYSPPTLLSVPLPNTSYVYTDSKLTSVTRPDGKVINYTYNPATGRLATVATAESTISITYDSVTLLPSGMTSTELAHVYLGYTGRVPTSETVYESSGSRTYARGFDSAHGALISDTVATGAGSSSISFGYDVDLNLTSAGDVALVYSIPNSLLQTITTGNQVTQNTYNSFGEILTQTTNVGTIPAHDLTLTYDNIGRIATKKDTIPGVATPNYTYTYDLLGRLTVVGDGSATLATYTYDTNGNRTQKVAGSATTNYTYDNQDRILTAGVFTFAYNAQGEMVSRTNTFLNQTTSYAYDSLGNLVQVTLPDTTVINYKLDTLGRRVGKYVNTVLEVHYVYADQVRIAAEVNPDQTIKRRYVYGSKSNIPDYYIEGLDKFRIISDQLGTPRIVINITTGTTIAKFNHDEFGNIVASTNTALKLPFDFAAGLRDWDTGLIHFGAREYDPATGRWLSKDPILFGGGDTNLYGYTWNDPINFIDPAGTFAIALPIFLIPGMGTAIGGAAAAAAGAVVGLCLPNDTSKLTCRDKFSQALAACRGISDYLEKQSCNKRAEKDFINCKD